MRWPGDEQFECPKCHCRLSDADMFKFKSCPGCETRFAGNIQPVEVPPPPLPKIPVVVPEDPDAKEARFQEKLNEWGQLFLGYVFLQFAGAAAKSPDLRVLKYSVGSCVCAIFGCWMGYRYAGKRFNRVAVAATWTAGAFLVFSLPLVLMNFTWRWRVLSIVAVISAIIGTWRGYRHTGKLLARIAVGVGWTAGLLLVFIGLTSLLRQSDVG